MTIQNKAPLIAILVLSSCIPLAHIGNAAPEDAAASPVTVSNLEAVTAKIDLWIAKGYYPGAGLMVVQNGKTLLERYWGGYDQDTVVYIASAGKWLAAATVGAVCDEGKLSWDDPVSKWLPEFKDVKGKATLRQLFAHTSGFPAYHQAPEKPDAYQTLEEAVAHIAPLPPAAAPGERWEYGGLAMQVGGRMAELAAGKSFEELFQDKIARPLGMTHTHFTPVDPGHGHTPMLGGGARSSLHDYSRFLAMIANGGACDGKRVLSENAVKQMQTDQIGKARVSFPTFPSQTYGTKHTGIYGLGEWRELEDANGNALLLSSPSWAGTYPWIDKKNALYGIFIAHVDTHSSAVAKDKFQAMSESAKLPAMVIETAQTDAAVAGFSSTASGIENMKALQKAVERVSFVQQDGNAVVLKGENETIRISVLTPETIRVQATTNASFRAALMVEAGFVKTDWPKCSFAVKDSADVVDITTAAMKLKVTKAPFSLELQNASGTRLFKTLNAKGISIGNGTKLDCEMTPADHFFGFGYMRKCFDARGSTLTWTRSYRNNEATVPFFMNPRGYAFFSGNTWKSDFDFTHTNSFNVSTVAGDLDVFLMGGSDFKTLLGRYTDLTGKPQLAPKWALGMEHRCRSYDDAAAVLESARKFREYNIPCELMALEPGWEEIGYSMVWQWSTSRFPDYHGMIRELKNMGFKFDLWESGVAPKQDLLNPKVRKEWFAQRTAALTNWGVDMFKQDDPYPRGIKSQGMDAAVTSDGQVENQGREAGEIITVANTFYSQTAFDEWRKLTGRRPVIQFHSYNASVASQRWPYQWAGDFGTGWGLLNASLSGHSLANADARSPYPGGRHLDFFMSAGPVNDCWAFFIEPWNYADRLVEVCRMYASLRFRLYPYLYSAMREAHETGVPILRPMVLENPNDEATYKIGSQFFIGDSLLVATSVSQDQSGDFARTKVEEDIPNYTERSSPVYLPRGMWIDYWTGREFTAISNCWLDCTFPAYAGGPLLVKAGGIIPLTQVKHYVEQSPDELITLDVYPGETPATHRLYEDDGITFGYEQGKFSDTSFSSVRRGNSITIDLGARKGDYAGKPARRDYLLKVHSLIAPGKVVVDGNELAASTRDSILYSAEASGWYYDAAANKIIIKPHTGWQFAASDKNPAATYPLTPAEERVTFLSNADYSTRPSRIEIALNPNAVTRTGKPTKLVFDPENTRVLADGRSTVKITLTMCDLNGNVVDGANQMVKLALHGSGTIAPQVEMKNGRGEFVFTAPSQPGEAQISVAEANLPARPLKLIAEHGSLQLVVNPPKKVRLPGKSEFLAKQFTIAVSVRDAQGCRLSAQSQVNLTIRDYKDRETIKRTAMMQNGEAEFRNVTYQTRPEKYFITATAADLESVPFKAFENVWELPDDYYTNEAITNGQLEGGVLKN
jgi:alpha-glucosidase (family GH31 glycosyl hydrolase)/CubicO group peptidase (beta-lactamase class C family)